MIVKVQEPKTEMNQNPKTHELKSPVVKKSLNPVWHDLNLFSLDCVYGAEVSFEVYDKDRIGSDDFMGKVSEHFAYPSKDLIPLSSDKISSRHTAVPVGPKKWCTCKYKLESGEKGEGEGFIYVHYYFDRYFSEDYTDWLGQYDWPFSLRTSESSLERILVEIDELDTQVVRFQKNGDGNNAFLYSLDLTTGFGAIYAALKAKGVKFNDVECDGQGRNALYLAQQNSKQNVVDEILAECPEEKPISGYESSDEEEEDDGKVPSQVKAFKKPASSSSKPISSSSSSSSSSSGSRKFNPAMDYACVVTHQTSHNAATVEYVQTFGTNPI